MQKKVLYSLVILLLLGIAATLIAKRIVLQKIKAHPAITCQGIRLNLLAGSLDALTFALVQPIGAEKTDLLQLQSKEVHLHGLGY
ncbi:MAG: hypothetical protein AAGJ18_11410, partial [Bacteroidota bacterium]